MSENEVISQTFRALVESADRKFARVRDIPAYGRVSQNHFYQKVFKAYMRLWKYQQENRPKLVQSGLKRWEIGEIASRIGQLYFGQYMRTSDCRFLVEAYVFYEAILSRRYFEGSESSPKDLGVRSKELRFYARFLLVSLILNRTEMVKHLMESLMALVDDCKSTFRETSFKEWRQVVQEIVRFTKVDVGFTVRPLRYCVTLDTHRAALPYVARFHAKRVVKFRDALLTSYHRNEVKFAELTLDTYRMMQCLEWEPSGSFYQKRTVYSNESGSAVDNSAASGLIEMNLAADMTDPTYPPNPRKAVLYRPSVTQVLAVMATICEELPSDSVVLVFLSASGKASHNNVSQMENSGGSSKYSRHKVLSQTGQEQSSGISESQINGKRELSCYYDNYLWFGPKGNGGSNSLFPGDLIPFTRKPLFLIIDSDNSHAFKAVARMTNVAPFLGHDFEIVHLRKPISTVLHGAERGETAALFLSPLRPVFKNPSDIDSHNGSQFTFFLTAPLSAFCQMISLNTGEVDTDIYKEAESMVANAFAQWEVILCSSTNIDLVWAQVLSDPFLRRLIIRFIFCRSVISFFCPAEETEQYVPVCLPHLPTSVAPNSEAVRSAVVQLAKHFDVADSFHFTDA